jgi:hypothetical protein
MRVSSLLLAGTLLLVACDSRGGEQTIDGLTGAFTVAIPAREFADYKGLSEMLGKAEWTLEFSDENYRLLGPNFRVTEDTVVSAGSLRIDAVPAPEGAFNCEGDEADALYSYELADGSLTLEIEDEPCALRGLFLEREWERN